MNEREKKILDLQCASTRRTLERAPDLDLEWFKRKIPKDAQVLDEHGKIFVNHRPITFSEATIEQKLRYDRGSHLAIMRHEPDARSHEEKKKETAIHAFMNVFSVENIKEKFNELMKNVKETIKLGIGFREK